MRRLLIVCSIVVATVGCGGKQDPFAPVPECMGPSVVPFMGSRTMVVSSLAIADADEGFDLDLDGKPDNKLSPLGSLANDQIKMSFTQKHDIILPIEMFGYEGSDNACTKFVYYVGQFNQDRDMDGKDTTWTAGSGDCDDTDAAIHPGATEDLTNRVDDDCDGYADNATPTVKPTDTQDLDGDGYSLAQGDCDDRADAGAHRDGQDAPSGRHGHLRRRHRSGLRRHPRQRSVVRSVQGERRRPSTSSRFRSTRR